MLGFYICCLLTSLFINKLVVIINDKVYMLSDLFDSDKISIKHKITEDEKLKALQVLFDNGYDKYLIDDPDKFSKSILFYLMNKGYENIAIYLINKGLKYDYKLDNIYDDTINHQNDEDNIMDPLIYSIKHKLFKIADLLLDKNIEINRLELE